MKFKSSALMLVGASVVACSSAKFDPNAKMQIEKIAPVTKLDDKSPVFSGNVNVQMLFGTHDPSHLTGAEVEFKQNARSAWHTHPLGQLLVVTKGQGLVQQWGEKARVMQAGEIVWTPPGIKHWHGACGDKTVTHYALQEKNDDGVNVNWMEKVTDTQYVEALQSIEKK